MQAEMLEQDKLAKFKSIFISSTNVSDEDLLELMENLNKPSCEESIIEPVEIFEGQITLMDFID